MKAPILTLFALVAFCSLYSQQWTELNPSDNLFNNTIFATIADKNGNVYAAGHFTDSVDQYDVMVLANGSWKRLGAGGTTLWANNTIYSLSLDSSGNLYAGGSFTDLTGNYYVAKWNGSQWSELGTGPTALQASGQVFCVATDKNGDVFAGGEFSDAGGNYYISEWKSNSWTQLGTGAQALGANSLIYAILPDASGNVYVAGHFTNASGKYYVAKWNGSGWSETGSGAGALNANGFISSLAMDAAGNIYAAGDFTDAQGNQYVAKWDGSNWTELGAGVAALQANGTINSILFDAAGRLNAAGWFTDNTGYSIARWTGSGWTETPTGGGVWPADQHINSLAADQAGNLYAGGDFTDINGDRFVAELSGTTWTEPGYHGSNFPVQQGNGLTAATVDTAGHVFVIRGDKDGAGIPIVEEWNGAGWIMLPTNIPTGYASLTGLSADSSGNVYACGSFGAAPGVAEWNGNGWTMLPGTAGGLTINSISHIATDKKGNVYISGSFIQNGNSWSLARWDGTSWNGFGTQEIFYDFVVDSSGTIYGANADFTNTGYNVYRVIANTSTRIGGTGPYTLNANNWVKAMTLDASGDLYVGGGYTDLNDDIYVAKWDGNSWTTLGTGPTAMPATGAVNALTFDKVGNLYAAGNLLKNSNIYIGKWDGQSWSEISNGPPFVGQNTIDFLNRDGQGIVYAGGGFVGSEGGGLYFYSYKDGDAAKPPPVCNSQARVKLDANQTTISNQGGPVVITATVISGEGANTTFEFATDLGFNTLLSGPSADSILSIAASDLSVGASVIYVKMQTIGSCNTMLTDIDSITITRNLVAPAGLIDADYPNTPIISSPNPFDKLITVSGLNASKNYTLSLYNGNGLKVAEMSVSGQTKANFSTLTVSQGLYALKVYDNTKKRKIGTVELMKVQ
jgi:hypothetical protein